MQVDLILDHFITYSGVGAVLVFISVAVVVLYVHPDPSPTTYIYDETTAMVGVAGGVVMGRAMGPANVMIALLERGKIGMYVRVSVCMYVCMCCVYVCVCIITYACVTQCSSQKNSGVDQ